jgi:hypothetical protein
LQLSAECVVESVAETSGAIVPVVVIAIELVLGERVPLEKLDQL